jgi:L-gulonate 3-dehydrogenase
MQSMAIVGAGFVGRAWAVVFARAGWTVRISDPIGDVRRQSPALLLQMVEELAAADLVGDPAPIMARMTVFDRLEDALDGVDFVQENGPERVDVKRAIFAELDRLVPHGTLLASSSSAIVASHFSEALPGRARCLIGHPVNPPHLIPVVELCGAPWTSAETMARARSIYESVGQVPVTVNKEIEGFVLNRLQSVVLAEALRLVGEGVVSPQDLDHTIKDGLGLRWSFMGPFETIELNAPDGIADYLSRYGPAFQRIASDPATSSVWEQDNVRRLVAAWGKPEPAALKAKIDWRDRTLAALVAHKQSGSPPPK